MMQLVAVVLLMLVLPAASVIHDVASSGAGVMEAIGKWFVYWGVGWRLAVAGLHQTLRPGFTVRDIFGVSDPRAARLVLEIGFGNLAIGALGVASLHAPQWTPAAALAGAIFYVLAGLQHVRNKPAARPEIVAMVSDLGLAVVLAAYLGWLALAA
ncbi:hypothetical protein ACFFJB_04020 [Camelimonas abortus]|uniref:DoxX family protein n=1 Tax=Camelimonas abortus TaxID=1017184 RepID=A0ABV7LDN6_9HYPH